MALSLSGTLRDPYGNALPGAVIRFDAVATSTAVLRHIHAEATTDSSGQYSIQVEHGRYNIRVQQGRSLYDLARNVLVNADTSAETLNQLIANADDYDELTPQIILHFIELRDEAASAVSQAEQEADRAQDIADSVEGSLADAVASAVSQAEQEADRATLEAANAAASARQAASFYPSVAEALADTESGRYFQVAEGGYVQLYVNDGGVAKPLLKLASQEELVKLNALPDPLLTSLLF